MPDSRTDCLVVGAGVSGLTTALQLARSGYDVQITTAEPIDQTTSMAAGALWGPYLVEPVDMVRKWSQISLGVFYDLAANEPNAGVKIVKGIEASRVPAEVPPWADQLADFRMCEVGDLPEGFESGWEYSAPLLDMPVYLDFLRSKLAAKGVEIFVESEPILRLDGVRDRAGIVINCTGSGAREFVPDESLTAIKGHLVVVNNPGLSMFFSEETGDSPELTHIYPQGSHLVLGGLAEIGNWDRSPQPGVTASILQRCAEIEPRLAGAKVIEERTGLRPTRREVRVELEMSSETSIVHNYGHGGAGVTLSWGCAIEVAALLEASRG